MFIYDNARDAITEKGCKSYTSPRHYDDIITALSSFACLRKQVVLRTHDGLLFDDKLMIY